MSLDLANLRVYCAHQEFLSHTRAAKDYQSILRTLCTVVDDPADAQVAMLHYESSWFEGLLRDIPALRRCYTIGYCVWEADRLPVELRQGLTYVDEVWTASAYCHQVFAQYHPNVVWVPHLVEYDARYSAADMTALGQFFALDRQHFNYLHITTEDILRKNTAGLVAAFAYVARRIPQARLIVKTIKYPAMPNHVPRAKIQGSVVTLNGTISSGMMAALYDLADVYVSPHCSEGWGFTISDAMLQHIPVVATGYSGNMDFCTPSNTLLVDYTVGPLREQDTYYLFDTSMQWAHPHRESLERQLLAAYEQVQDGSIRVLTDQARRDVTVYDRAHLTAHVRRQMQRLAGHLR